MTPDMNAVASSTRQYKTVDTRLDAQRSLFWCYLNPLPRPCFTPELLADVDQMQGDIPVHHGDALRWFACASAIPGVFNLGGDLSLFRDLIGRKDRDGLRAYGEAAVKAIYRNHIAMKLPVVSIALVQGDALGGGFECALAFDVIIAERQAKFGLPEVLFNLFPGMGAYSFLSRRIGRIAAEKMILSGRIYSADELHAMGIVDMVVETGQGEDAVNEYVDRNMRNHNARMSTYKARRAVDPVTFEELCDVVYIWADAALRLTEQELRRMARLISAQDKLP